MNSTLDEFDLAGLNLTEEQKNEYKKLDGDMERIANLLAEIKPFNIKEIKILNKSKTKTWNKNKFYE
ncbi:M3 family metallopeptidase [Clostridium sporogenes]|uniref:M3 family metallopeptidase n=1 Tax=Clostridium sporogenes TaxID=1509 RepID=UPI0013D07ECE|nr:M3 family metallopeptidase [Clostridium sporogenes]NFQ84166.1 M3 family metallopeptidase [Clostridium sporogenes]